MLSDNFEEEMYSKYFDDDFYEPRKLTPTEFIRELNETFGRDYDEVRIEGEVMSYKVSQGKWIFFDIKDESSSINCFMSLWNLRMPIEDGMKIIVTGTPGITKWGKFSLTVKSIKLVGEGSLKKAYELLKKKLEGEGLFRPEKKRPIPDNLTRLGVISSVNAAGYADFVKIINARWGGMKVTVAHTQVQGAAAPDQIIRALKYFNEHSEVEAIAIIRGGGSADDLSCFNDEKLVRAIASSKIPVITGIGHEVDESLADLAADKRGSTPSNVAEMLTKDRALEKEKIIRAILRAGQVTVQKIEQAKNENRSKVEQLSQKIKRECENYEDLLRQKIKLLSQKIRNEYGHFETLLKQKIKLLEALNPEKVLKQGYAILTGKVSPGSVVKITTLEKEIKAEIKEVYERK